MIDKLIKVQAELKAPKSKRNSFGNYNYRSCEDILEAVKPLLKENGLQLTLKDEVELVGDRYYIKATATISDGMNVESVSAYAREADDKKGMDASQISGTASSYARKYALNGLFLIDDTKDADTDEYHQQTNAEAPKKKAEPKKAAPKKELATEACKINLKTRAKDLGLMMTALLGQVGWRLGDDLTQEQADQINKIMDKVALEQKLEADKNE